VTCRVDVALSPSQRTALRLPTAIVDAPLLAMDHHGSRLSRRTLLGAALVFPAVAVVQTLTGAPRSAEPPLPLLGHLVVVTYESPTGTPQAFTGGEALARFESRRLAIAPVFADSDEPIAAGTSLMLGSGPRAHGVRCAKHRVDPESWSLARAAAAAGYQTVAISDRPLAGLVGIPGFARLVESGSTPELVDAACATLTQHRLDPLLLWLHLPDADDADLPMAGALERVLGCIEELGTIGRTTLVLTSLGGGAPRNEEALAVPFFVQYPGASGHSMRYRTLLSLSDVAPGLRLQLRLPGPDDLGVRPAVGRGPSFVRACTGAQPYEVVRCEGDFGVALRGPAADGTFPGFRAFLPDEALGDLSQAVVQRINEPGTSVQRTLPATDAERAHALKLLERLR
jgi:hypothetical protein